MSLGVRSVFQSSLLKQSRFCRFFEQPETPYKILKAADPLLDAAIEISKAASAPIEAQIGLHVTRVTVGSVRDFLSYSHLVFFVIPSIIVRIKLFFNLARHLESPSPIPLVPHKKHSQLAYNQQAFGRDEKLCCLGVVGARFLQGMTSTVALGVCRPIVFFHHEGAILSRQVEGLARSYQYLLVAKNILGIAADVLELWYHSLAYRRACSSGLNRDMAYQKLIHKSIYLGAGTIEKGLQAIYHVAKILKDQVPPGFRIPLACLSAGLGLFRTCMKLET